MPKIKELNNEESIKKLTEAVSKGVTEDLNELVNQKLETFKKETNLDKVDLKHLAFPTEDDPTGEKKLALTRKEKAAEFIKHSFRAKQGSAESIAQVKSMTEGTDEDGGFLVSEEVRNEIVRLVPTFGIARRLCRVVPMNKETQTWPTLSAASNTVTWPGEGGKGTSKKHTVGLVQLNAKKAVALTPFANELLEDADVGVVQVLFELIAEQFAGEEDNQLFNGVGSPFTGLLTDSNVNVQTMPSTKTAFSDVVVGDLSGTVGAVNEDAALDNAAWFMSRTVFFTHIVPLNTSSNQKFITFPGNGSSQFTIFGYPVHFTSKITSTSAVSTKFIAFGDLRNVFFGDRRQLQLAISQDATMTDTDGSTTINLFEQDLSALRVTERVAIKTPSNLATAFAVLKTAAS